MRSLSRRKLIAASATGGLTALGTGLPLATAPSAASATPAGAPAHDGVIRVEAFGAVADGKTDCTQAFLNAIAAAASAINVAGEYRAMPIVLAAGAYRLTQPIHFSHTCMALSGAGHQNTVLLIDHDGPGLVVDSGGNCDFRGFGLDASLARRAGTTGDGVVCAPLAGSNFSYLVSFVDVSVMYQPGNGFTIYAPEAYRMENVFASHNKGDGCLLDARQLENICNLIDFARFSYNGGYGLHAINVANSIFSRVECLDNRGPAQFRVEGNYNTIAHTDCEAGTVYTGNAPVIGLILSGKGNIVQMGDFYHLSNAISLQAAHDCRVLMPKIEGERNLPMQIGIDIGADCTRNIVDYVDGNLTTLRVRDRGTANRVTMGGIAPLADAATIALPQHASARVVPDLALGHTVHLVVDGLMHVAPPVNAPAGALFTLVIDTQAHGLRALTFAEAYRAMGDFVAAHADRRYVTCAFVATGDGRCLPHAMFSYD